MIVAITGNRDVTDADRVTITRVMRDLVYVVRPAEIIFGGARGVDTLALIEAQHRRSHGGRTVLTHSSRLVVIVPDTVAAQPHEARDAIRRYADEVIERRHPISRRWDNFASYRRRNEAMVSRATHVLGFWSSDTHSGTYACLCYAQRIGREVWVEGIDGGDR